MVGGDGGEASPLATPLPLTQTKSEPWQSESLLAESWSTLGDAVPGDTNSLESSESAALATNKNHSSNSEREHLEQEEATETRGRRREEVELQTCVLCAEPDDIQAPQAQELLVSVEEPHIDTQSVEFMQVVPPMALPPLPILQLVPPSTPSTPIPSTTLCEPKELHSTPQGLHPPSILAQWNPPLMNVSPESSRLSQKHSVQASQETAQERDHTKSKPAKSQSSTGLPLLLCGGALVAIVGVAAYGAVTYCRK